MLIGHLRESGTHDLLPSPLVAEEIPTDNECLRIAEEACYGSHYRILSPLGKGGQGVVFLARREGADGFACKVALKFFFCGTGRSPEEHSSEMRRAALRAARTFELQHDNLVGIRDFIAMKEIRVMVMEWIDGGTLEDLLNPQVYENLHSELPKEAWERVNEVVLTRGKDRCALKPGFAVAILRGCLAGLATLHNHGIIHCDLKPSNIMVNRTGAVKIIDMDSSIDSTDGGRYRRMTPYFMAPELFSGGPVTFQTDIASLGYTFIELVTGQSLFGDQRSLSGLEQAKQKLPERLDEVLQSTLQSDPHLFELCHRMIAVRPEERFVDAESADIGESGAASFHRELVKGDLWANYEIELTKWVDMIGHSTRKTNPDVFSTYFNLLNGIVPDPVEVKGRLQ